MTIHITKEAIEQGQLGNGFFLTVTEDGSFVIKKEKVVRDGWDADFKRMHEVGDDRILFKDDLNDIADWTW